VITGAASGIGKAIAERCCAEGMKVVIADIEENALIQVEKDMKLKEASVISVITDVSKQKDLELLAKKTLDEYGAVHLLFNNAGVGTINPILNQTMNDYLWVINVNLWGVIYGMYTFYPIMANQDEDCHIINTSSAAGVNPGLGVYGVTKFGVTALSEMFSRELKTINSKVKVSVVFPGIVNTRIIEGRRNRPEGLKNPDLPLEPELEQVFNFAKQLYSGPLAMSPQTVADIIFNGIKNEILFIFTDLASETGIKTRTEAMLKDMNVLKEFIEKSRRKREEFHSQIMDQGYKSANY
jgi:NADP-dependent 3-hydroxy acid dehydrogenase YdfG